MRLDRLLGITLELMTKKRVTASDLAAAFEVSVRTIYRDIELIQQARIPVASFSGAFGGFELMNGFLLTKQYFSVDDLSVIYMLLKAMEQAMGSATTTPMRKLASLHPVLASADMQDTLILSMSMSEHDRTNIQQLFHAIRESRVVELAYTSSSGTTTERSVEPLNICWEKGVWYMEGYCRLRRARRHFRISRLIRLAMTEATFVCSPFPDESDLEEVQGIRAHLRFSPTARLRVLEQFPGECVYHGDYIDVHTTFYKKEYALSVIASYGTEIHVVSPDALQNDVIAHIEAICRHYANKPGGDAK